MDSLPNQLPKIEGSFTQVMKEKLNLNTKNQNNNRCNKDGDIPLCSLTCRLLKHGIIKKRGLGHFPVHLTLSAIQLTLAI